jgi:hypothetical protein
MDRLQRFYAWLLPIKPIYFDLGLRTIAWKWYGGFGRVDKYRVYRVEK